VGFGRHASMARTSTCAVFFDAAPEISKNVPMLIGSVSEEGNQMSIAAHRGRVAAQTLAKRHTAKQKATALDRRF
jgi:para-nitrobenzyl esterase